MYFGRQKVLEGNVTSFFRVEQNVYLTLKMMATRSYETSLATEETALHLISTAYNPNTDARIYVT
jgi:hypothetical protein